jgi:predicted ATPase
MKFTSLKLGNWRNFQTVDVELQRRAFVVGPNAAGKSNLLDVFRFLRDVADPEGGFQRAVLKRGGISQIRSLHARRYSSVIVVVGVDLGDGDGWTYLLEFSQDKQRRPVLQSEMVLHGDDVILDRPDADDKKDATRLTQTHLEQVNANREFRALQEALAKIRYLHIVPQLVRDPSRSVGVAQDPFGGDFLEQIARTPKVTQESRLRKITESLRVAVPQLKTIQLARDARGVPHLRGLYEHWRQNAGWQNEDQFSDGTLRLLGLLWSLLDGTQPLLLEEPELSLHPAVVKHIPTMMARLGRKLDRQIFVSTHSADLLMDPGITPAEVLLLSPTAEDTKVQLASDNAEVVAMLQGGASMSEAALPKVAPQNAQQLALFGE